MPSVSRKQHNLMAMVAHDPAAAKRLGIPQSVGQEFVKADTGHKFAKGGQMKESGASDKKQDVALIKKAFKQHDAQEHKGGKGTMLKLAKGGFTRAADGVATKGKTRAMQVKMAGSKGMKRGGMC